MYENAIIIVALIGFVAFRMYLSHHRRIMIHRERITAIEKGVALPVDQEVKRSNINVQRILLLSGLIWISIGIAAFVALSGIINSSLPKFADEIPRGMQYVALAPIGIGIAHLIVYFVGIFSQKSGN